MAALRRLGAALLVATCSTAAVAAESAPPAPAPVAAEEGRVGRYTMVPAEGGFVRLDTETGVVSHCRRETAAADAGWRCATIPEAVLGEPDRAAALATRVDGLAAEVAALRKEVAALTQSAATSDVDAERALRFGEEVVDRFFTLMREMRGDDPAGVTPPAPINPP